MTTEEFEKTPCVLVSVAAVMLGVCRSRVNQLLASGKLSSVYFLGQRYVSLASIRKRKSKQLRRARK
jgi:predicted Ser/Thr protein kinase